MKFQRQPDSIGTQIMELFISDTIELHIGDISEYIHTLRELKHDSILPKIRLEVSRLVKFGYLKKTDRITNTGGVYYKFNEMWGNTKYN